ncbi:unnamed protein product [Paramecium sonneborni]|uniref:Uncharacterized protein n=1 Tax=Paramecium sonneborni TaxID=65129 RepID=A0A8S1NQL6_9CILI|nr:unnamed protein product [Paramecium sonneborni]
MQIGKLNKTQVNEEKQNSRVYNSMQVGSANKNSTQDYQVHLRADSAILIPLIDASMQAWDENVISEVANKDSGNYETNFYQFKHFLEDQCVFLKNNYDLAIKILEYLDNKKLYVGYIKNQEAQLNIDEKARSTTNIQNTIKTIRKDIYRFRKELKEIIAICAEAETPLILNEVGNLKEEILERYNQLMNDIIPGILFDDISIEIVQNYYINQSNESSDEVVHFNSVKQYHLSPLIPRFRAYVYQIYEIAQSEFNLTQNFLNKLQQLGKSASNQQNQSIQLYYDLPSLIDQFKVNLNQQCSLLPTTLQDDKDYWNYYQQNVQLKEKINNDLISIKIKNEQEQQEKSVLQIEFNQLVEQQDYFHNLFLFQKQIPILIDQLRDINQQKDKIWKDLPENKVIEKAKLQQMLQSCINISNSINDKFPYGRIPFKFQQVSMTADNLAKQIQDLMDLNILQDQIYVNNPSLTERIKELMKWEYNGESIDQAQGENAEINSYLANLFELNSITNKPPQIEIELNQQLDQCNPENINEIMELNENYNIWKNMQAAGMFLNEEYLQQALQDCERLPQYAKKLQSLKTFFSINQQMQYVGYITDVLSLIQLVQTKQLDQARLVIQQSKNIPRIYKSNLLQALN